MNSAITFTVLLAAMAALETKSASIPMRCQCTKILPDHKFSIKTMIPTFVRGRINRYPAGAHCKNEEVIIEINRRKMCVNPIAEWVIALEKSIQLRSSLNVKTNSMSIITTNATTDATATNIANSTAGNNLAVQLIFKTSAVSAATV